MNETSKSKPPSDDAPAAGPKPPKGESRPGIEDVIFSLCTQRGPGRMISPTEAAKAFAEGRRGEGADWHHWIHHVRRAAIGLARAGKISIYRKGKPADPEDFRGLYKLGLPPEDAAGNSESVRPESQ
ncbi:MAG: hypothetical protein JWL93_1603 [Hyphomicrobiales bacterium]|nr:hypothetical protein [Hyphomicrobiales bacterium]